ncbi:MAG: hypothetical protein LBK99_22240 [Opitutaceae bacterium]|jgi:restriction system protein|nr:hypothetical protein [Opitutaceae bacterium]
MKFTFTKSGIPDHVEKNIAQKVILIDGDRLAELMLEHGVGVSNERNYTLKRIDSDYFEIN